MGDLLAPVVFAVAFEIVRLPVEGPTVDAPHLSTYGVFAFVVGRGFHALLSLLPMAVGAAWGAFAAARRDGHLRAGRGRRVLRWTAVTASVVVVAGLALLVARPASTAPITGANGEPVPGSIAELTSINVNGRELGLMIRGHDTGNPVLLFLAGGPGGSELGAMRNHLPAFEKDFTVATLDQRGTGTSYPALDPIGTYTLESAVEDTIATTNYLRERFGVERVVLVGQSWGTILGVLAVHREPALYSAFVGVGQMVSPVETDRVFYTDTLAWAREPGQTGLAAELERDRATAVHLDARLRDRAVLRAAGLPLRPQRQQRGRRRLLGELPRAGVHLRRPGPPARRVHGHLRSALPGDPRRRPAAGRAHARGPGVLCPGRPRGSGSLPHRSRAGMPSSRRRPRSWWCSTGPATGRCSNNPTSSSRS